MDAARKAPARLDEEHIATPPILFLYGAKDQIIPRAPTAAVAKELDGRAEVHVYPDGYHMLLRDLDAQPRWNDVAEWIDKHTPSASLRPAPPPQAGEESH